MKIQSFSFRTTFRFGASHVFAASGLLAGLVFLPAHADDLADVNRAIRSGQYADALKWADAFLAKHPHDAQMRFLKGVILDEQNKPAEAIVVFTKLTEDYPELPEPYNNLAVLYAANEQYDKARIALENAIRTNPAYATAYENLGDVHAKLASQAYDKALQLDSGNAATKSKLVLLRTLAGNGAIGTKTPAAKTAAVDVPATVAAVAIQAPKADIGRESAKPVTVASAAAIPPPVKVVAPPKPEPKSEPQPTPAEIDDKEAVVATVQSWARAWSERDVNAYLNFYGADFETPKGISRQAWATERHQRIEGKGRIEVKVESLQVSINGNTATVKFRQIYSSDKMKADSHKVLILSRQSGRWQIEQEHSGS